MNTREENPDLPPEIYMKLAVINFKVTPEGLTE